MTNFINMLIAALYAMLVQNLVFTAAYGIDESIKIAKHPKHFIMCAVSVGFYCTATAASVNALEKIGYIASLSVVWHYAVYIAVLTVLYAVTGYFCVHVLKANKKFMNSLGMCAFNSLVLSVPFLNFNANHTFFEALGTGIGASLAFALAVLLINAGIRHISANKNIPRVFRGTPALLIYIAILSLALSCISGESLFV